MVFDRLPEYRQQNQFTYCYSPLSWTALLCLFSGMFLGEISYGSRDFIDLLDQRVISFRLKYSLVHSLAAFTALSLSPSQLSDAVQ
jgi:hypothetical protein